MTLHRLETRQIVPVSLADAWLFFTDPRNLARITPPDMGFEVTTALPPHIYPGLLIGYRVRPLFGVPVQWVTEIMHVVEESMFVDEQRVGPYRLWHHEHVLTPTDYGTEVRDTVSYMLPFGSLSSVGHPVVRRRLAHIFEYRRTVINELFGAAPVRSTRVASAVS